MNRMAISLAKQFEIERKKMSVMLGGANNSYAGLTATVMSH